MVAADPLWIDGVRHLTPGDLGTDEADMLAAAREDGEPVLERDGLPWLRLAWLRWAFPGLGLPEVLAPAPRIEDRPPCPRCRGREGGGA